MSRSSSPAPSSSSVIPPGAFAVNPKKDCPHVTSFISTVLPDAGFVMMGPCKSCGDRSENWVCLTCFELNCARAVNGCGVVHSVSSSHPIALSVSDLSVWCYACDEYITHEVLQPFKLAAYRSKFGEEPPTKVI